MTSDVVDHVPVLIAGAGPVGLTLAHELEHHGIDALIVERNTTTTRHPKMDVTNGRSMELFRRFGVADYLRKVAVPADRPMVVNWVTNYMPLCPTAPRPKLVSGRTTVWTAPSSSRSS